MKRTQQTKDAELDAMLIVLIDAKIKQLSSMLDLNKVSIASINLSRYNILNKITLLREEKDRILNDSEYLNFIIEED